MKLKICICDLVMQRVVSCHVKISDRVIPYQGRLEFNLVFVAGACFGGRPCTRICR